MMRARILLSALTVAAALAPVSAQKFGYIDSDYILGKLPQYATTQAEIDRLSDSWQAEIAQRQKEIDALYGTLGRDQALLTEQMKQERLAEIEKKRDQLADYQKKVFGFGGLFFLKKQELIKPLQDEVFEAVKRVAKSNKLAIVFDKAADLVMIYTDPTHDYTDFVLEELGLGDPNDQIK